MRRRGPVLVVLLVAPLMAWTGAQQQFPFRTSVTGVAVHVSVRQNGGPVTDLSPNEFRLRDAGRAQTITAVSRGPLPLDVTLVVEQRGTGEPPAREYQRELSDVIDALSDGDRLRVISAGSDAFEIVRLDAGPRPRVSDLAAPVQSAAGSILDGLTAALVRPAPPGRQPVVILMTSAQDAMSFVHLDELEQIAMRSDAQLHVVLDDAIETPRLAHRPERSASDAGSRLWTLARTTGGDRIWDAVFGRSIATPVRRVFDGLRAGYILYYTPEAGDRGWRPIEVTIGREGRFDVKSRAGYLY